MMADLACQGNRPHRQLGATCRSFVVVYWKTPAMSSEANQEPTVDAVFDALRVGMPSTTIERLEVTWPADDNNLWFIRSASAASVQIENGMGARAPFLVEGDGPGQRAAHIGGSRDGRPDCRVATARQLSEGDSGSPRPHTRGA